MFGRGKSLEKVKGVFKCSSGISKLFIKSMKEVSEAPVMHDEK